MAAAFQVWQSPGGMAWEGDDQEEAILAGLRARRWGVLTEVAELFDLSGRPHPRRIACYDDRRVRDASVDER